MARQNILQIGTKEHMPETATDTDIKQFLIDKEGWKSDRRNPFWIGKTFTAESEEEVDALSGVIVAYLVNKGVPTDDIKRSIFVEETFPLRFQVTISLPIKEYNKVLVSKLKEHIMTKQLGGRVNNFVVTLDSGAKKSFYDLTKDKTVVLFFYPSSSKYSKTCQKQAAAFNEALSRMGKDVQVIGVSTGDMKELQTFKQKFASNFPVGLVDKYTQEEFGARRTGILWRLIGFFFSAAVSKRVTFIIDKDRTILERIDLPQVANGPAMTAHAEQISEFVERSKPKKAIPVQENSLKKQWLKERMQEFTPIIEHRR